MFVSLGRVSYLYYEQGLTQQQIATRLRISRPKVGRMLKQARETGVVKVQFDFQGFFPELEAGLKERYPGVECVVADSLDGSTEALLASLGGTCAEYLDGWLRPREVVAVGWGRTLTAVAERVGWRLPGATFVPLIGGYDEVGLDIHANSVAATFMRHTSSSALALFAPAIAASVPERNALLKIPTIAKTLRVARAATTCLLSIGSPGAADSAMASVQYHSPEDLQALAKAGAMCDIVSINYHDGSGRRVATEVSDRTVSLTEDQLLGIPRRVCIAGGPSKWEATRVALELGVPTTLITDDATARHVLEY